MNRVEELTLKLIDRQISENELAELDRLLADDPQAGPVHVSLLDLEAALLSRQDGFDIAPQTMARIREPIQSPEPDRISVIAERRRPSRRRSARPLLRMLLAAKAPRKGSTWTAVILSHTSPSRSVKSP